jgi:hypothetical protein
MRPTFLLAVLCLAVLPAMAQPAFPYASKELVFIEQDGVIAAEAEHAWQQTEDRVRAWHLTNPQRTPAVAPDGDPNHAATASGGGYLEILPDTRRNHGDKLIGGRNFSNAAGKMAILTYNVRIDTPGRYHVWARIFSTNSEDNGLHVGIDGTWPASGQRMQWIAKKRWAWGSKQRTAKKHTGVPHILYLDIEKPGLHTIHFSMREDGTEFDKWLMVRDQRKGIEGAGPKPQAVGAKIPPPFAVPAPAVAPAKAAAPRLPDGDGTIKLSGELRQWHDVVLDLAGPFAHEQDRVPNPFTDYRLDVLFSHEGGEATYRVPGYFAADGDAANSSAESGTVWRVHFRPDRTGIWSYRVQFSKGKGIAVSDQPAGDSVAELNGKTGSFTIELSDKTGRDLRAKGRLDYVGKHYLRFAGSGEYFLKQGADAPENLLAYADFDGAFKTDGIKDNLIKKWDAHVRDWQPGDPTWGKGRGKALIGAINYLASEGMNAVSMLTLNINGDDRNVFPYTAYESRDQLDVSKLAQWEVVLSHAERQGLFLHFKTQETENECLLDNGDTGPQRRLYYRELIARFGHHLALNWNLGEENGSWGRNHKKGHLQSTKQRQAMAQFFHDNDPYQHHIVIHNGQSPDDLLGDASHLTGFSLQTGSAEFTQVHRRTLEYLRKSRAAGKPWVVACDEPGDASHSLVPDADDPTHDTPRANALWGQLLAGGAGCEWYFGYKHAHSDLTCQDWRSRDLWWDQCRIALDFFRENDIPFWEMANANALVGNPENKPATYCFASPGRFYVIYRRPNTDVILDLTNSRLPFELLWFNPRTGGKLAKGSVSLLKGGAKVSLGQPPEPAKDWVALIRPIAR